jgi:uncharacterized protein YgiM (DUF1202 family)
MKEGASVILNSKTLALVLSLLLCAMAVAQEASLSRNTNLRTEPIVSAETKIRTLQKGTVVELLSQEKESGFYHVRVEGEEGWVYARNVRLETTAAPEGVARAISPDWEKPEPHPAALQSSEGTCGLTGDGGDSITNKRKNRVDIPDSYHPVTFEALTALDYPKGRKRSLEDWSDDDLAAIANFQGAPISVEAYLYKIKVESYSPRPGKRGGESTNCHFHLAEDVDWHMPLTLADGDGEETSVIVETTPRVRKDHPKWKTTALKPWTAHIGRNPNPHYNHQKIRISGWLMLDPEHQDMINSGLRNTLWEIHPITKIEVQQPDGSWSDLDD